ncbi:MAG: TIM barrel protein [Rhodospirillaceae bacterium]
MTGRPHPLSVSRYVCDGTVPFPAFAAAARDAGLAAVGVTRASLREMGVRGVARCLADNGLAVSSLNSAGYFTSPAPGSAERENSALVDAAAELGAGVLCVITGGIGGPGSAMLSVAEARQRVAHGFAGLAERAAAAGVTIGLEPIHPSGIVSKGCINSCAHALETIAPYPGARLILDLAHSWWDPDLPRLLRDRLDAVALLQICNVRMDGDSVAGRDTLAAGMLDLAKMLPDLLAGGYSGTLELEIFGSDLRGSDPLEAMREFPAELAAALAAPAAG